MNLYIDLLKKDKPVSKLQVFFGIMFFSSE